MDSKESINLNNLDEGIAKLMCNYSELKTCGSCMHEEHNECEMFDINVPDTFTCLSFKGEEDGI